MNVFGSRESIIEFRTVELEDEGGRNEKPSVVADACNVELYQYMPEESPNLLQCGRNNHDGYEKSVLRNPSSTEKALSIIDGSNPKTDQENARSFALENIYSSNKTPVNQKPEKDDRHSAGSAVEIVRRIENGDGMSLGSSKPSTIESNCCGRISTRYPFQLKRKNLKDFFGGPPTFQDLPDIYGQMLHSQSGSLPHEVSNMDADNAVTYRFYDASHHDEIGLETFQVMLLKSGASSSNATKEYSLDALLDVWLSKQLAAGKLFVGQKLREQRDCLLAVSFSSPMVDKDLFSHHHEGTVVGFYYLVKRARDQTYHLWVAKATENSTYSVSYNLPGNCQIDQTNHA
ncbi:BRCA2, helical [Musa troglodytarum]|uniref:BRCA2, helical n=1 Tax=Musa troglodytarum TaxID=320322 RepID=A0A9E7HUK6_9LILI|nr:BRCA2, helical [Musa troglodytarum]